MNDKPNGWRLDRTVPLAVVGVLLAQTIGIGAWVGAMSARVSAVEQAMADQRETPEQMARLDERLAGVQRDIAAIHAMLTRNGRGYR